MLPHPTIDAPPPLRGTDPDSFAEHTVTTRLPNLLRRTMETADLPDSARAHLQTLHAEIPQAAIRAINDPGAPDSDEWEGYVSVVRGGSWAEVPWFFAETYFYRRILEATGYFGGRCSGVDPFAPQKSAARDQDAGAVEALAERTLSSGTSEGSVLSAALETALWGNQADLSMWPGADRPDTGHAPSADAILSDDRDHVQSWLDTHTPLSRVDVILDNVGFELAADLALAHTLLDTGTADRVLLHAKTHPTFISDATTSDVHAAIGGLDGELSEAQQAFSERLQAYVNSGRLAVSDHLFWTSPLPGWGLSRPLYDQLEDSDLLISKGDANYRRWLGDLHWAPTADLRAIVNYAPAPLLLLRTLKSEVIAGLDAAAEERARNRSESWMTDGTFGVIQFAPAPAGHPAYPSPAAGDDDG